MQFVYRPCTTYTHTHTRIQKYILLRVGPRMFVFSLQKYILLRVRLRICFCFRGRVIYMTQDPPPQQTQILPLVVSDPDDESWNGTGRALGAEDADCWNLTRNSLSACCRSSLHIQRRINRERDKPASICTETLKGTHTQARYSNTHTNTQTLSLSRSLSLSHTQKKHTQTHTHITHTTHTHTPIRQSRRRKWTRRLQKSGSLLFSSAFSRRLFSLLSFRETKRKMRCIRNLPWVALRFT
jgi:hypothetical protein